MIGSILEPLRVEFEKVVPRMGEKDEAWHSLFESFLTTLADRRKQRYIYRNYLFVCCYTVWKNTSHLVYTKIGN